MKAAARKVMWVGRATVFLVGLAVILALTVGLASVALAGTGVGARFDLGKTNAVNAISKLVGNVVGPSLLIDNNSTGTGATALRLEVQPGKPPMSVNSTTEVQGLNVDSLDGKNSSEFLLEDQTAADAAKLDGKDSTAFFSGRTYVVEDHRLGPGGGGVTSRFASCDPGDIAVGGGGASSEDSDLLDSAPLLNSVTSAPSGWFANFKDEDFPSEIRAVVLCADFPPLRPQG